MTKKALTNLLLLTDELELKGLNMRLWLSLAIFVSTLSAGSVTAGSLKGRILDSETGNPIWGANITIIERDSVIESSRQGTFEFTRLPDSTYRLVVSHVAYDHSDTLRISVSGTTEYNVTLTPKPWVLEDVVVTGTRSPHLLKNVPVQTEVVARRDFERTGATTVDEALTSSIGVAINDDLSGKGATIRGVQGDRILVLVDGERAVGRVNGTIDLGQFSLANVEKIEIVKGTGSTLYGSDAMGGVVNIITNKIHNHSRSAKLRSEYGAYGSFNPDLQLEFSNSRWGANLGAKYYRTDGFDLDKSTPHTNGQDAVKRINLDGKLRYLLSERWTLTSSGRWMTEDRDWVESEALPILMVYDDTEFNDRYDGSMVFDYLSGDKYSMKLRFYGSYYDHQWNKVEREFSTWVDTSKTKDYFFETSYSSNYVIGQNHVATYGFDYNYQDLKSSELAQEKEADEAGDAYLQYEYSPHKKWTFLPGVRYEYHSSFGGKTNPSINIMYQPSEQFKLRGFTGYGFRAPSIKEQYFTFDHTAAGYVVYGGRVANADSLAQAGNLEYRPLKDENSINASISAEFSYGSIGMHRITYFYNHLNDLIDFVMIGSDSTYYRGIYVYQNIERATTQGIEWESRVRLSQNIDFSFSYDYLKSLNLTTGDPLTNRPSHTFKFYLSGYYDKLGIGGTFWGTYNSRKLFVPRTNTGGNEGAPEDWAKARATLNVNVFKRMGNLEAYVRVENLLDQVNMLYGYWPGISVYTGFKYDWSLSN
jgi:outer membrane receptor for ferrienterochelin and colicins